jgi:predicted metal-dependent phosphoesterase TrpH
MPSGQPFTALCQALARSRAGGRADLHLHTTHSDGTYTPEQVVELARRSGLAAIAITDHDTTSGVGPAQAAAIGFGVEVVPGVEITAEYRGRELHLLGFFFRLDDTPLNAALKRLRQHRVGRFRDMVERLHQRGISLPDVEPAFETAWGRRHLAALLVQVGRVGSVREAFQRYLGDDGRIAVDKLRLPVAEAIALVRGAGGVAAWAHPFYDDTRTELLRLRELGLQAVEVDYPAHKPGWIKLLRAWAGEIGLAVTGGSDCHGPGRRGPGTCGVTGRELDEIRQLASIRGA